MKKTLFKINENGAIEPVQIVNEFEVKGMKAEIKELRRMVLEKDKTINELKKENENLKEKNEEFAKFGIGDMFEAIRKTDIVQEYVNKLVALGEEFNEKMEG